MRSAPIQRKNTVVYGQGFSCLFSWTFASSSAEKIIRHHAAIATRRRCRSRSSAGSRLPPLFSSGGVGVTESVGLKRLIKMISLLEPPRQSALSTAPRPWSSSAWSRASSRRRLHRVTLRRWGRFRTHRMTSRHRAARRRERRGFARGGWGSGAKQARNRHEREPMEQENARRARCRQPGRRHRPRGRDNCRGYENRSTTNGVDETVDTVSARHARGRD